jgi:hypothetical protein
MTPEQARVRDLLLPGVAAFTASVDVEFDDQGNLWMVGIGPAGAVLRSRIATAAEVETGVYKSLFNVDKFWSHFVDYLGHFERERTEAA